MSVAQAIILGVLQGITEFLPVSSSGHLVLARAVMGVQEVPVLFDVVLHLATLFVVFWMFRVRIWNILSALGRLMFKGSMDEDKPLTRLSFQLVFGSCMTAALGFPLAALDVHDKPFLVGFFMVFTAFILLATLRAKGTRSVKNTGWMQFFLIGTAQGLGVLPGISRSGITIGTGLFLGLDRKTAGELSFLLSIPAVLGAFLLSLKDVEALGSVVAFPALMAGFFAALISGYVCLRLLLWLVSEGRLWVFAVYLVPMGLWVIFRFLG